MKTGSPIIIIGMHRSGTTMVARLLQQLGLFIGNDLEANAESRYFIKHNDWLMHQCGATWFTPGAVDLLASSEELAELTVDYLHLRLQGPSAIQYLGWQYFLAGRRPLGKMGGAWGWKDPRMTFTLPYWLRLFPDARIIHIYRNGVSVAASLRARSLAIFKKNKIKHARRKRRGPLFFREKTGGYVDSARCFTLEGGFSLWEEYIARSLGAVHQLGPRALSVKYEDFLATPAPNLQKIADFCGLDADIDTVEAIATEIVQERAMAFLQDEELSRYYQKVKDKPLMVSLGYQSF